jgi:hypothetical protein
MTEPCIVVVRRGALHLARDAYERFFDMLNNVVLLRDGKDLVVLPVRHQAAGGYLLKLRNGAGDRIVSAADFFRANGIDDDVQMTLTAEWSDERMALIAADAFMQT